MKTAWTRRLLQGSVALTVLGTALLGLRRLTGLGTIAVTRSALTVFAVAVGALLLHLQLRFLLPARWQRWLAATITGTAALCSLFLVWLWPTEALVWRAWWIATVFAVLLSHLGILFSLRSPKVVPIVRANSLLAFLSALLLAGPALRSHAMFLTPPGPLYLGFTGLALIGSMAGTLILVRSRRPALRGRTLRGRGVRLAVVPALLVAALFAGFYLGRITAPPPSPADVFPSVLKGLSRQEIESQLESDLARLRRISGGIDDLSSEVDAYRRGLQERLVREEREVYLPVEDDRIRSSFLSYLAYRTALLRLLATYSGFESVPHTDLRARSFLVGFAAALTAYENSLKLVNTYGEDRIARRKLNEPEPAWGIPADMFNRIHVQVTSSRNRKTCEEMAAYFERERAKWREAPVWTSEKLTWLTGRIDRGLEYVRSHSIAPQEAWLRRVLSRVQADAYTPVYATQSLISEWIGDTRIIEREPFIRLEQIEEIEPLLEPGDILLERRNWFLSNAFLPGFWPHAAIYIGSCSDLQRLGLGDQPAIRRHLDSYRAPAADGRPKTVIEAVSEGVIFNSLAHSLHADYAVALRPRLSREQIQKAILRAFTHAGKPYDFEFDFFTSHQLVCTEVVYRAYEGMLHFDLVAVMGRSTLPAIEIARKYVRERGSAERELDFVLFLDAVPETGGARLGSEEDFCLSIERPQAFNE